MNATNTTIAKLLSVYSTNSPLTQSFRAQKASILIALFVILMALVNCAWAGAGHDHDDTPAAAAGKALPRVTSHSDLFELVGVVDKDEMTIYIDRYGTNEPVKDAKIDIEIGTVKGVAIMQPDGSYLFKNDVLARPGELAVSFTVVTDKDADLLAGDLKIGSLADDHADDTASRPWLRWALYAGGALLLIGIAADVLRRRKRTSSVGKYATLLVAACTLFAASITSFDAIAGPGHDHGEAAAPAASGNTPKRLADGSVFLPKPSQRQLGIRTAAVEEASLPRSVELTGRVVADANAGGKVQPTQAGRIEAGPRGLPILGQAVRKGEVLVVVRASSSAIERANQQSQTSELRNNLELARKRVARLDQLEGTVPQKDIDAARLDVASLQQRTAAIAASVLATESLLAPVSGVISSANVVLGQVVDAREVLFEIVDPSRLSIEASAFDAGLISNIASASVAGGSNVNGKGNIALQFAGAGRTLRDGAIPLLFRTEPGKGALPLAPLPLAINQPIKVVLQTKDQIKGFAVPTSAVVKSANNQDMVWVHTGAEKFVPRSVRVAPLSGSTVSITDGLQAGDRVVSQGAPLINQVR